VPAFGVLDIPNVNKETVSPGFIGLKVNTTKAEMIRAIIDSLVFTIKIKMDLILSDLDYHKIPLKSIR
jgi:sugar (pentulose or hexulose) kinase